MFRCFVCDAVSEPGTPLKRHTVYRQVPTGRSDVSGRPRLRKEIECEVPVCHECAYKLDHGKTLGDLLRKFAPPEEYVPPPVRVVPLTPQPVSVPVQHPKNGPENVSGPKKAR